MENLVILMETIPQTNTSWENKRVLVTGGAGFVGSWLSYDLAARGANVVILDIKSALPSLGEQCDPVLKKTTLVTGDVRDAALLHTLFVQHSFDTVFHLAAHALVGEVIARPDEALDINIMGTVRVLEEARHRSGVRVVVASSDKAYGIHTELPYKEDFALRGENHPYDCSKSCADQIARMYAGVYNLPVVVLRCGNIYGGGDLNFSRIIPGTIQAMLENKPIEIRSDGLFLRDYIYIKDAVYAYLSCAEHLACGEISGSAFNFGHNKPLRVLEVVNIILELMNKTYLKPIILNQTKNEIPHQYLDATKSKEILGWEPAYAIEDGLRETAEWYTMYFQKVIH